MVDISVVTSLYRAENFLENYSQQIVNTGRLLHKQGIILEVVIVSNEATDHERVLISKLQHLAASSQPFPVKVIDVPRESVYASWNRGVQAAEGKVIGFWNADDIRHINALLEAFQALPVADNKLMYFPYTVVWQLPNWTNNDARWRHIHSLWKRYHIQWKLLRPAIPFDPALFRLKTKVGPFFMFTPELYQLVGPFDDRFKIVGDLEWCIRAMKFTDFTAGKENAGELIIHGKNLSGVYDPLENVEKNMIYLMHGMSEKLVPAEPQLMREVWEKWDIQGGPLTVEIQEQLWGRNALSNWENWKAQQLKELKRARVSQALRFIPRQIINKTGLREPLTRLRIVKRRQVS